ncbi:MAG: hypothetical protein WBV83_07820 [Bradyrhizobium sp.]|jgi:hypothetical protein|uniref:hypothetical protein n=1 Tax=Bradyrhizobium sp. TaxID=376 RepID=UPI003BE8B0EE
MISRLGYGLAGFLLLAAASGLDGRPAHAQVKSSEVKSLEDVPLQAAPKISPWPESADPQPQEATESPPAEDQPAATAEDADIANLDIDWSLLDVDASTLMMTHPVKLHAASRGPSSDEMTWSSQEKANGSAVSVKQPVSPFWDARVGADMTVVRQPSTLSELLAEKASNGGNEPQSSGTAWASATAPGVGSIWDKTTVEARVDPSQDQGKLGTSLSKSLTLSEQYSLTLQNGYNMTQGLAPMPGSAGHTIYETEQSAKFGIADTGTSFSAGQTLSTTDDRWLRKIGAEQKIVGGFNISGSIAETPLGIANKSVSAGFKQSW